jgi:hypothetical protein
VSGLERQTNWQLAAAVLRAVHACDFATVSTACDAADSRTHGLEKCCHKHENSIKSIHFRQLRVCTHRSAAFRVAVSMMHDDISDEDISCICSVNESVYRQQEPLTVHIDICIAFLLRHLSYFPVAYSPASSFAMSKSKFHASHPWHDLDLGEDAPKMCNAVIEIPRGARHIKWASAPPERAVREVL